MFPDMNYHTIIRNGEFKMSYEDKVCSRCFRKDVREYVTYNDYNLCTKCIDIIDKYNIIIRPTPLVTMKQNIYNIDKKYNDNNIYINEINQKFKIIDRISHDTFKIMINDKIKILHYKEIIDKYWDCLSFCDKEYIINLND
jgi:hypothetical protein